MTDKKEKEEPKKEITKDHKWYIVNGSSGQEKKIALLLETRIKANDLEKEITDVVVPTLEKVVIKQGKKTKKEERLFPGYILIRMVASDTTIHLVRNTEGIIGFIGSSAETKKPTPLSEKEAAGILKFMEVEQPTVFQSSFNLNDAVKVVDGPFKEFVGTVQDINHNKGEVSVIVSMFGREVPVKLDFLQVQKI